jgi:hypothetical protein
MRGGTVREPKFKVLLLFFFSRKPVFKEILCTTFLSTDNAFSLKTKKKKEELIKTKLKSSCFYIYSHEK